MSDAREPFLVETDWCSDCQTRHAPNPERTWATEVLALYNPDRCPKCGSRERESVQYKCIARAEHPWHSAAPPRSPIVLRYDVEVTTADGAVLAGWLELPTGAHTPAEAWTIKRNIFNLDWSDARITEMSETRATAALSGQQDTTTEAPK